MEIIVMNEESEDEIIIKDSSFTLDNFINQSFIPEDLKNDLKEANTLFIPKIVEEKPFFEILTLDLFHFLKQSEGFKVNICIKEEDFQYLRSEAEEIFIALGIILIEKTIIEPLITKIKEFFKKKKGKKKSEDLVELTLLLKKTKQTKITEIQYKGSVQGLEKILEKIE